MAGSRNRSMGPRSFHHSSSHFITKAVKCSRDPIGVSVSHRGKRPRNNVSAHRPDLDKQIGAVEVPIFKYVGRGTDNVNVEPADNEGNRLRIGAGQTVVHSFYAVLFGRDGNAEAS